MNRPHSISSRSPDPAFSLIVRLTPTRWVARLGWAPLPSCKRWGAPVGTIRMFKERDLDWLDVNLGRWMNTHFGHDAAIVLSADGQVIYQFATESANGVPTRDLSLAYSPLAHRLHERLIAGDQDGMSDRVLSIGESDLVHVGGRPAVVSVKPIISDTGKIEQRAG
ncbi:CHASE4 domain-containing protein [Neorhizobium sp. T25_13]|uniref:CHASE4 domain-containing protein n=1 Tax=Neorhizobium sp. T25_13 TaxID=2093830 RepID=UPI001FE207D9|nr:CHASE4 domain-containing protein [Neorhizobium sp. T25_13]